MPTPLTEEMIVSGTFPEYPHLAPDGSRVAYLVSGYGQEGDHPEGTIWVAPTDGSAMARQWTFGGGRERSFFAPPPKPTKSTTASTTTGTRAATHRG